MEMRYLEGDYLGAALQISQEAEVENMRPTDQLHLFGVNPDMLPPQFSISGASLLTTSQIEQYLHDGLLVTIPTFALLYNEMDQILRPNSLSKVTIAKWVKQSYAQVGFARRIQEEENGKVTERIDWNDLGPLLRAYEGDVYRWQGDYTFNARGRQIQKPNSTSPLGTPLIPWGEDGKLGLAWLEKITNRLRNEKVSKHNFEKFCKQDGRDPSKELAKIEALEAMHRNK